MKSQWLFPRLSVFLFFFLFTSSAEPLGNPLLDPLTAQPLTVDFKLKPGYSLFMKFDASTRMPMGELYYQKKGQNEFVRLETYENLRAIMDTITTSKEALSVAEFLTKSPTRYLLKEKPVPALDVSTADRPLPIEISGFLSNPVVKKTPFGWLINRDLVTKPVRSGYRVTISPRLIRSHEIITETGEYTFKIDSILLTDDRFWHYFTFNE